MGWFLHAGRGAADLARAQAELAAARDDRDRQYDLYRDAVEHSRNEQRAEAQRVQQQNAVLTALAPVRESLQQMQTKVTAIERERHAQFGTLRSSWRLRAGVRRGAAGDDGVPRRSAALDSHARSVGRDAVTPRGGSGRAHTPHRPSDLQATISSDRGQGRPDMVIRLAGGSSIGGRRQGAARRVSRGIGAVGGATPRNRSGDPSCRSTSRPSAQHIDALAKKAYWAGLDASPEFVICLPAERVAARRGHRRKTPPCSTTRSADEWLSRLP